MLHVRSLGSGDDVVLLLHGIPGSGHAWLPVAERLAEHGTVLVPDLLGFGASARPTALDDLHAAAQAIALDAELDRLGRSRVVVAGHDFGGPVALRLLALRPERVRALALLATNAFPDTPVPFPLSLATAPVVGPLAGRALFSRPSLAMMLRTGVGRPRVRLDTASAVGDRAQAAAIRTVFAGSLRDLPGLYGPVAESLAEVRVPTLVGWGERDPFFSVDQGRRTAAAVPGARFRLYEGAGHFLPEERPDEVAADLAALVAARSR